MLAVLIIALILTSVSFGYQANSHDPDPIIPVMTFLTFVSLCAAIALHF